MQWHRVKLLIDHLEKLGLSNKDFFHKVIDSNGETIDVVSEQHSVVRTNCMVVWTEQMSFNPFWLNGSCRRNSKLLASFLLRPPGKIVLHYYPLIKICGQITLMQSVLLTQVPVP